MPNFFKQNYFYLTILFGIIFLYWGFLQWGSPHYFLYDDNATQYLAFLKYNWESLFTFGEIPFINFHQYLGIPYIGQAQTNVFYPPGYASVFFSYLLTGSFGSSYDVYVLIHFLLAGFGVYCVLQHLKTDKWLSLGASLLFITFPFVTLGAKSWLVMPSIVTFLPWNFFFLLRFLKKINFSSALCLGAVKAMAFYAGHPQFIFILCYTEFIFLVFYFFFFSTDENRFELHNKSFLKSVLENLNLREMKKKFLKLFPFYLFSIISLVFFVAPELLPIFKSITTSVFRSEALSEYEILKFSVDFFSFLKAQIFCFDSPLFGQSSYVLCFVGLPFYFLFTCFFSKKLRSNKWWLSLFFSLLLIFLLGTVFYKFVLFLPFFDLFRWPFKHFVYFLFFLTVLVSVMADFFLHTDKKTYLKYFIYGGFFISLILNVSINVYYGKDDKNAFGGYHLQDNVMDPLKDLISKKNGRVLTIDENNGVFLDSLDTNIRSERVDDYLLFNTPTLWNYFGFGGYDQMVGTVNYFLSLGDFQLKQHHLNILNTLYFSDYLEHLAKWSGRYIITHPKQKNILENEVSLKLIYEEEERVVYENLKARPLIYLNSKPQQSVDFEVAVNRIMIHPKNKLDDILVLNFAPIEGYQYRFSAEDVFQDLKTSEVNLDKSLWTRKVCEFEGEKLDPCIFIEDKDKQMEILSEIEPLKIKIPANTKYLEVRYRDKYFFFGVYVLFSYIGILILSRIIWNCRNTKK